MNTKDKSNDKNESLSKAMSQWIRITILATGIPIFNFIFIGMICRKSLFTLLGNGDIILSLFALQMTMLYNIFEEKTSKDDQLLNAGMLCGLTMVVQLAGYTGIKVVINDIPNRQYPHTWYIFHIGEEIDYYVIFIIFTLILFGLTIWACITSINAIHNHKEKTMVNTN